MLDPGLVVGFVSLFIAIAEKGHAFFRRLRRTPSFTQQLVKELVGRAYYSDGLTVQEYFDTQSIDRGTPDWSKGIALRHGRTGQWYVQAPDRSWSIRFDEGTLPGAVYSRANTNAEPPLSATHWDAEGNVVHQTLWYEGEDFPTVMVDKMGGARVAGIVDLRQSYIHV